MLEKFGEPDNELSGLFGDTYICEDKLVIIYYEGGYGSDTGTVSKIAVTERQIKND